MTEDEKAIAIAKRVAAHEKAIEDRKKQEIKEGFLNPFGEGVSYEEFQKEVEKSKVTIAEYCGDKITEDQLKWLEKDINIFNSKKKK